MAKHKSSIKVLCEKGLQYRFVAVQHRCNSPRPPDQNSDAFPEMQPRCDLHSRPLDASHDCLTRCCTLIKHRLPRNPRMPETPNAGTSGCLPPGGTAAPSPLSCRLIHSRHPLPKTMLLIVGYPTHSLTSRPSRHVHISREATRRISPGNSPERPRVLSGQVPHDQGHILRG